MAESQRRDCEEHPRAAIKPCSRTRQELDGLMKDVDTKGLKFDRYFFTNFPGTKKHPPRDDLDDDHVRCKECGCTIAQHQRESERTTPAAAVQRSPPSTVTSSESRVASTKEYQGLNQFSVHIPSEYNAALRGNIETEFSVLRYVRIETRWVVVGKQLGVRLIVYSTQKARALCLTILSTLLKRNVEESEMAMLHHRPSAGTHPWARHHSRMDIELSEGEVSSGAANTR